MRASEGSLASLHRSGKRVSPAALNCKREGALRLSDHFRIQREGGQGSMWGEMSKSYSESRVRPAWRVLAWSVPTGPSGRGDPEQRIIIESQARREIALTEAVKLTAMVKAAG